MPLPSKSLSTCRKMSFRFKEKRSPVWSLINLFMSFQNKLTNDSENKRVVPKGTCFVCFSEPGKYFLERINHVNKFKRNFSYLFLFFFFIIPTNFHLMF